MVAGIYSITSPSNKVYIGQSQNIKSRWSAYKTLRCKRQPAIYNSLLKYGVENHRFEVIQEINIELLPKEAIIKLLNDLEIFWEEKYRQNYELLNIRKCGGCYGPVSLKTKEKISKANAGKSNYFYNKRLVKEKNGFYGKKHTQETKDKLSKINKGKIVSQEIRDKQSKAQKGRKLSQETKDKLSQIMSGKNNPNYGRKASKETKQKMSKAHKGEKNYFYNNPQKGPKHGRYDSKYYYFYNKDLDLHVASTKYNFRAKYNLTTSELARLVNSKAKKIQGWIMA